MNAALRIILFTGASILLLPCFHCCDVINYPPECSILVPADGAQFVENSEIGISVRATDRGGTIESVILYINGEMLETIEEIPHTFTWNTLGYKSGRYEIKVEAVDDDDERADDKISVLIYDGPEPITDFSVSHDSAMVGELVTFLDQTLQEPETWKWDFGDGSISVLQNVTHAYNEPGLYSVTLIAGNSFGSDTVVKENVITVWELSGEKPVADFSVSQDSVKVGEMITFLDESLEDPETWMWDFGDGNTSGLQNPGHAYTEPGLYTVTLICGNEYGSDTITKKDLVHAWTFNETEALIGYIESTIDPISSALPALVSATSLNDQNTAGQVYIIDIRSEYDYSDLGHIENAVNVPVIDVRSHLESNDLSSYENIVIVDYTGQTAVWLCTLMRLAGYDNVYALKWGMESWHQDFATRWNNNISSAFINQFVTTVSEKNPAGVFPTVSTGYLTPEEILSARIDHVLEEGFQASVLSAYTLFEDLDSYYIIYYWTLDYDPGRIPGAVQYTIKESFYSHSDLNTLPAGETIGLYDANNQLAIGVAAYLRVLGYDVRSVKFGANAMIYESLTDPKWKWLEDNIKGYEYIKN